METCSTTKPALQKNICGAAAIVGQPEKTERTTAGLLPSPFHFRK